MKIAVVTGASSGMGRQFVLKLDRQESFDEIWVLARRKDRLDAMQKDVRAKVRPLAVDLTRRADMGLYRDLLMQQTPEVKVLVNAAGFGLFGTFKDMDLDQQLDIVALNDQALTAMTYMTIPYMKPGAAIYNIGSLSSFQPVPYMTVYGASKAYVLSFSQAMGVELAKQGIRVMAVCPGWIKTEFFDRAVHDDTVKYYNRYYSPEQVADQALIDMAHGKAVSVLGRPERRQVRLVKHLPTALVMRTWVHQQKLD